MNLSVIFLWALIISCTTIFGSWYARRYERPDAIIGLYVALVVFSNIAAVKIAEYDLGFTTYFATAASLIFPVTFLLTDIINEKFGRLETHRMIFIAFISQVFISILSYLVLSLPSAPFWAGQEQLSFVLGQVPRIMVASWIAFLISENLDAIAFDWLKKYTKGKHLWARNAFSSIPAMLLDSVIFVVIAFYGTTPLLPLIIGVTAVKWLVGIIDIPFMYVNRAILNPKNKA